MLAGHDIWDLWPVQDADGRPSVALRPGAVDGPLRSRRRPPRGRHDVARIRLLAGPATAGATSAPRSPTALHPAAANGPDRRFAAPTARSPCTTRPPGSAAKRVRRTGSASSRPAPTLITDPAAGSGCDRTPSIARSFAPTAGCTCPPTRPTGHRAVSGRSEIRAGSATRPTRATTSSSPRPPPGRTPSPARSPSLRQGPTAGPRSRLSSSPKASTTSSNDRTSSSTIPGTTSSSPPNATPSTRPVSAPTGLYGFAAPTLTGPYEPLNESGLVLQNPSDEPDQAYAWLVLPDLHVISFANYRSA